MNSVVWNPVIKALESRYRVHLVDLPGHGFNYEVVAPSMQVIVDQLSDLIESLDEEQIHIMGWSLGGLIAQALAESTPEKIRSLTLVASTLRFSQDESESNAWPHAMSLEVLNNFAVNLSKDTAATLKRFIALQFMGVAASKETQKVLIQAICPAEKMPQSGGVTVDALTVGLKLLTDSDFRDSSCDIPQHWLFAEKDRLIPMAVIDDLKSLRPDAQVTLLQGAGHAPFMTHPDAFVDAVSAFIDSLV